MKPYLKPAPFGAGFLFKYLYYFAKNQLIKPDHSFLEKICLVNQENATRTKQIIEDSIDVTRPKEENLPSASVSSSQM